MSEIYSSDGGRAIRCMKCVCVGGGGGLNKTLDKNISKSSVSGVYIITYSGSGWF